MPQVNSSLIPILPKIAIFEILPNFDPIFRGEGVEIAKIWLNLSGNYISRAIGKCNQICKIFNVWVKYCNLKKAHFLLIFAHFLPIFRIIDQLSLAQFFQKSQIKCISSPSTFVWNLDWILYREVVKFSKNLEKLAIFVRFFFQSCPVSGK